MPRASASTAATLIPDGARVLTHCNTGALATGGIGTALAAVYIAVEQGKRVEVYADETRPLLQGSRLTAWELQRAGIPVTVLADGAAASLHAPTAKSTRASSARIASRRTATSRTRSAPIRSRSPRMHHACRSTSPRRRARSMPPTARGARSSSSSAAPTKCACGFGAQTAPRGVARLQSGIRRHARVELITAIVSDRGVHRPPYDFSRSDA